MVEFGWLLADAGAAGHTDPVTAPLLSAQGLFAMAMLTVMEVVLGIDNIIFIAIAAGKLPPEQKAKARMIGLTLALLLRIVLLCFVTALMGLNTTGVTLFGKFLSLRDLIMIAGGGYLIFAATKEVHEKVEAARGHGGEDEDGDGLPDEPSGPAVPPSFGAVCGKIVLLDVIFSVDSILTAMGMVMEKGGDPSAALPTMIAAVVASMVVMLAFSGAVVAIIDRFPTLKMLALAFLLMIGMTLIAEGFGNHVNKWYLYFAMGFSIAVETLNITLIHKPKAKKAAA